MATCNIDTLLSDADENRFTSVPAGMVEAVELQLLYAATGGTETVDDLVSGVCASEFLCLPEGMSQAVETQMLCNTLSQ